MISKTCSICNIPQPISNYHKHNQKKSGLRSDCKSCRSKLHITRWRSNAIYKKYGITQVDYNKLLIAQNNTCAICGSAPRKRSRGVVPTLVIDHCHRTNKVRGLLCDLCNVGLGSFKDNPESLLKAIVYLKN